MNEEQGAPPQKTTTFLGPHLPSVLETKPGQEEGGEEPSGVQDDEAKLMASHRSNNKNVKKRGSLRKDISSTL